jgi:DNA polymerase-3 subunit alpha
MGAEAALRRRTDCTVDELREGEEGSMRVCGGVVTALAKKWTRKGDLMATFTLEDLQSAIEVMVFPKTMAEHGHKLVADAVVCVKGRIDKREDEPKLVAMTIEPFEPVTDGAPPLRIRLAPTALNGPMVDRLRTLLQRFPGESQVFLHLGETKVLRLPGDFCVEVRTGLVAELRVLLGPDAIVV